MSWLDKIWVAEPDKAAPVVVQKAQEATPVSTAAISSMGAGYASDEYMTILVDNVKAKAADNSYFKLRAGMDVMIANKMDERNSAIGASAMIGLNKEAVLMAVDEVVLLVASEREGFVSSVYQQAVSNADALTTHSEELQAQINSLLDQVKQLSEENINTQQEANRAHNDAEVMLATFDATVSKFTNTLTAEKVKLTTYLS